MKYCMSTEEARNEPEVAAALLVVGVGGDVVDVVVGVLEHRALPVAEGRHPGTGGAADDQLEVLVGHLHGGGGAGGELAVVVGGHVAGLPGAVHLVAEAPHPDVVRLGRAVGDALVAERRAGRVVRVLEQVERRLDAARAEVDGEHELGAGQLQPARELVEADLVRSPASARRGRGARGAARAGRPSPPSGNRRRSCRRGSGWWSCRVPAPGPPRRAGSRPRSRSGARARRCRRRRSVRGARRTSRRCGG